MEWQSHTISGVVGFLSGALPFGYWYLRYRRESSSIRITEAKAEADVSLLVGNATEAAMSRQIDRLFAQLDHQSKELSELREANIELMREAADSRTEVALLKQQIDVMSHTISQLTAASNCPACKVTVTVPGKIALPMSG